jgi:hypothetical protein
MLNRLASMMTLISIENLLRHATIRLARPNRIGTAISNATCGKQFAADLPVTSS